MEGQQPIRALIVDDDPIYCAVMARAAENAGCQLVVCHDAGALMRKDIRNFDIIFMDYFLDNVRGSWLANFLGRFFNDVPVFILSSSSYWYFRSALRTSANIKRFYHKDTSPEEIIASAKQYIYRSQENSADSTDESALDFPTQKTSFVHKAKKNMLAATGKLIMQNLGPLLNSHRGSNSTCYEEKK